MTYTAIIPLRAGSKRIPWKNIKSLNWKPLFLYTLDSALKVDKIINIVITTDDEKVINILDKSYKKYLDSWKIIIINRDKKLAWDNASSIDVILDVLEKNKDIENIILLQATSPFRNYKNIKDAILKYENKKCNSLISINKVKEYPYWQHKIEKDWLIKPLLWMEYYYSRSQDLPKTYIENWAICIINKKSFINNKSFYTDKTIWFELNEIESIDIDEPIDFEYCEFLLNNWKIWNF